LAPCISTKKAARHALLPTSLQVLCMMVDANNQEALMHRHHLTCPVTDDGCNSKVNITFDPSQPLCCWPRLPPMCISSAVQAAAGDLQFGHSRGCSRPGSGLLKCVAAAQGPCLWRQ